jgi:hypothetical protein
MTANATPNGPNVIRNAEKRRERIETISSGILKNCYFSAGAVPGQRRFQAKQPEIKIGQTHTLDLKNGVYPMTILPTNLLFHDASFASSVCVVYCSCSGCGGQSTRFFCTFARQMG